MHGLRLCLIFMGFTFGCWNFKEKSDDSGGDWVSATCNDELRITGQFKLSDAEFPIDESLGEGLNFLTEYKIAIDPAEAGCISDINLEIKQGGLGCKIDLEFDSTGAGEFAIAALRFSADSHCPNFPAELVGEYTTTGAHPLAVAGLPSQVEMKTGTEETVCLDDIDFQFEANGTLHMVGSDTEHDFELSLNLTGDHWSTGSTSAVCESTDPGGDTDRSDADNGSDDGGSEVGSNDDGDADIDDGNDGGSGSDGDAVDDIDPSEEWPWPGEFLGEGSLLMDASVGETPISDSCVEVVHLTVNSDGYISGEFNCTIDLGGYATFEVSQNIEAEVSNERGDIEGSVLVLIPFVGISLPFGIDGSHSFSETALYWEGGIGGFFEMNGTIISDRPHLD